MSRRERATGRRDAGDHEVEAVSRKAKAGVFRCGLFSYRSLIALAHSVPQRSPVCRPWGRDSLRGRAAAWNIRVHFSRRTRCGRNGPSAVPTIFANMVRLVPFQLYPPNITMTRRHLDRPSQNLVICPNKLERP
jgi:hypothetical protein